MSNRSLREAIEWSTKNVPAFLDYLKPKNQVANESPFNPDTFNVPSFGNSNNLLFSSNTNSFDNSNQLTPGVLIRKQPESESTNLSSLVKKQKLETKKPPQNDPEFTDSQTTTLNNNFTSGMLPFDALTNTTNPNMNDTDSHEINRKRVNKDQPPTAKKKKT